jgi:glycine/D-amino acid oxidase-like deaminating enzyme
MRSLFSIVKLQSEGLQNMLPTLKIADLNDAPSSQRIFIVGGGIVGTSLAFQLSQKKKGHQIVLIDKCLEKPVGSTGHAPGFVGQLNESPVLTRLAKDTVSEYLSIPGGFNTVGGLELSSTASGVETLYRRRELAQAAGLSAEIITPEAAASLAPDFIDAETVKLGLHFSLDGTANAQVITSYYFDQARAQGVEFVEASVTGFSSTNGNDGQMAQITAIQTTKGDIDLQGSTVILATGIWTSLLTGTATSDKVPITEFPIPIVPVAHPYTFTPPRPLRAGIPYPFVRWLDHHVYARDHGDRDGMGSYDHAPLQLDPVDTAIGAWPTSFDKVLSEATLYLKNGDQFQVQGYDTDKDSDAWVAKKPFNGIFSVTPDNLPLAGKVPDVDNLWICAAIWVTTAAGTAKLLSRKILGEAENSFISEDERLLQALSPARFRGIKAEILASQALGKYNDIYNRDS